MGTRKIKFTDNGDYTNPLTRLSIVDAETGDIIPGVSSVEYSAKAGGEVEFRINTWAPTMELVGDAEVARHCAWCGNSAEALYCVFHPDDGFVTKYDRHAPHADSWEWTKDPLGAYCFNPEDVSPTSFLKRREYFVIPKAALVMMVAMIHTSVREQLAKLEVSYTAREVNFKGAPPPPVVVFDQGMKFSLPPDVKIKPRLVHSELSSADIGKLVYYHSNHELPKAGIIKNITSRFVFVAFDDSGDILEDGTRRSKACNAEDLSWPK